MRAWKSVVDALVAEKPYEIYKVKVRVWYSNMSYPNTSPQMDRRPWADPL